MIKTKREFFIPYLLLALANTIFLFLAIKSYNGPFNFWTRPYSDSGTTLILSGLANTTGQIFFSLSMFISGIILLNIAKLHLKNKSAEFWLALIGGLGFLLTSASPDDIAHPRHVLGAALGVASLWLLATIQLSKVKFVYPRITQTIQVILQFAICFYALTYFLDIKPLTFVLQKITIFSLILSLPYSAYFRTSAR